ncbi:MAG: hypothetical protein J4F33_04310 [Alphaproteobacteria bacterium]|nr:hypothetical protein [Alphaproteobacteria bacterium]
MLRRLIDGAVLVALAWFLIVRLDAGQAALGLTIAAVIVFTVWRIHRLWQKYRRLLREVAAAEAGKRSDDPKEVERAERILRDRRMMHAADMTLMSGFVLGGAAHDFAPMEHGAGVGGSHDGMGSDGPGGFGGGDMGGSFGGGEG